jgi:hypothetical protein
VNGDELEGTAVSEEPNPPGTPVTALRIGPSQTSVAIENVTALLYPRREVDRPTDRQASFWLGLRNGTRLAVRHTELRDDRLELRLHGGAVLATSASQFWKEIAWLQPVSYKKYVAVSDHPMTGYKHIPLIGGSQKIGIDQNVLGGGLRCAGHFYLKGLGMQSASRVSYSLGRRFRRFEADVGIDDAAGVRGSVVFRVYLDRAPEGESSQWNLAYESQVVRGGTPPVSIRVDVSGAERMALVVDFADRGDECDYANWLLPRLIY